MSTTAMVVLIVLIVTIGRVLRPRFRGQDQGPTPVQSADAMRLEGEMRQLKERIAVLERVVTDNHGSIGLDREIERLRDHR